MRQVKFLKKMTILGVSSLLLAGCFHHKEVDPNLVDMKKPSKAHLEALKESGALPPPPELPSPQSYNSKSQWAQGSYAGSGEVSGQAQNSGNAQYNPPPAALEQGNTPGDTEDGNDVDNM
ncbi:hypothetical protein FAI41_01245 [Acetobacteraceae bacterium]|nr:hypothetical protein FAI41_01245 [Acetobacteraceae bacterium]